MKALKCSIVSYMIGAACLVINATAFAGHVGCGDVLVADTTLDGNVGPCGPGTAITIGADCVTLDLNGFSIIGPGQTLSNCPAPPFNSIGISIVDTAGVGS